MAETYLITEYKSYDFDEANKHFSENGFPEPDPVVGDRSRTGIVTCSDPRCNPEDYFKLDYKEAFVVRNEGGRAADPGVVRSLVLIAELSAPVGEYIREVKVIHHTETDCSALKFDRQLVRDIITQNDPNAPGGPFKEGALTWAESLPILAIPEGGTERERLERSVRDDVRFLREHPLWKPKMAVTGWIYDLHTRLAERVDG